MGERFDTLEKQLARILNATKACSDADNKEKAAIFFRNLPEIYRVLNTDVEAIYTGDPAANSKFEVIRAYPGFYAICFYPKISSWAQAAITSLEGTASIFSCFSKITW
jgi:serine O-acetyltransferase